MYPYMLCTLLGLCLSGVESLADLSSTPTNTAVLGVLGGVERGVMGVGRGIMGAQGVEWGVMGAQGVGLMGSQGVGLGSWEHRG